MAQVHYRTCIVDTRTRFRLPHAPHSVGGTEMDIGAGGTIIQWRRTKNKDNTVSLLCQHMMQKHRRTRSKTPLILNLFTRWRLVIGDGYRQISSRKGLRPPPKGSMDHKQLSRRPTPLLSGIKSVSYSQKPVTLQIIATQGPCLPFLST